MSTSAGTNTRRDAARLVSGPLRSREASGPELSVKWPCLVAPGFPGLSECGMPAVENTDLVAAAVGRWSPSDVAFIRELHFTGNAERPDSTGTAEVVLRVLLQPRPVLPRGWPDPHGKFWEVALRFSGVRGCTVAQVGAGDIQTEDFGVEDLSRSQREGIRLKVSDGGERFISFWAKSAIVLACREASERPAAIPLGQEYPGELPR